MKCGDCMYIYTYTYKYIYTHIYISVQLTKDIREGTTGEAVSLQNRTLESLLIINCMQVKNILL